MRTPPQTTEGQRVLRRVEETRAMQWWIDRQITRGRSDEQIAQELPVAAAFIAGRVSMADIRGENT